MARDSSLSEAPNFERGETKLIQSEKEVEALAYAFIERAINSSYLAALADRRTPKDTKAAIEFTKKMYVRNPNLKVQIIVDLQKENEQYYKELMDAGVDLRHIEGNRVTFALSKDEYIAAPLSAVQEQMVSGAQTPREVVWSTRRDLVSQAE